MIFTPLDIIWILVCTALVLIMQVGFCCLETGLVRSKNSINVAAKNLLDLCVSSALFLFLGFGLMFGSNALELLNTADASLLTFFLFQLVFCGTAVTIVSCAVAERMRLISYIWITCIVATLIYPVIGNWVWGGAIGGPAGWLAERGFIDFAGSMVVHAVGGWVALAAILIIGPRIGRFDSKHPIQGNNISLAAVGLLLLWVGWFGFNGGSLLKANDAIPGVLVNTMFSAVAGTLAVCAFIWTKNKTVDVPLIISGALAGLVSVTASAHAISLGDALIIGMIGGYISLGGRALLEHFKIDDVIDVVPVHCFAGIWGTIAVALFADLSKLDTGLTRYEQLLIQMEGILFISLWAFIVSYIILRCTNHYFPLRVSQDQEIMGLNVSEHRATTATLDLLTSMEQQRTSGDFTQTIPVEPHTEAGQIAEQYNRVLERVVNEADKAKAALDDAEIANKTKGEFLATVSHELRTPLTSIKGSLGLILGHMDETLDDRVKKLLIVAQRNVERQSHLVNDLLDFQKMESGNLELDYETLHLGQLVKDAVDDMAGYALERKITITYDNHLLTANPSHLVKVDKNRLSQVIINLLSNAVKFSPESSNVNVTLASESSVMRVSVIDKGLGIPEEFKSRIFQQFSQANSTDTRLPGGTGLGLAISKNIIEAMGGDIGYHSKKDSGTIFYFTLPMIHSEDKPSETD